MDEPLCTASGTAATSCGLTSARPPAGPFLPGVPCHDFDRVTCSAASLAPGFEDGVGVRKVISKGRCVATLAAANYRTRISRTLPHPHPARATRARCRTQLRGEPPADAPLLPPARPSAVESLTANSQRGAIPGPGLEGLGLPPGSSEKYSRFPAPASPPPGPGPPGWAAAAPRYLPRSRARPHSARRNPNPCCGLLAGRPQPPARLRGARGRRPGSRCRGVLGAGSRRRQPWWHGLGNARRRRPGGGSAEASAARAPLPAPCRPMPESQASAGWRVGARGERAGRGRGRCELGGAGASGLAGARRGLNTPGAVPLLLPAPRARRPGVEARGEVLPVGEAERGLLRMAKLGGF